MPNKPPYANDASNDANRSALHLAVREMRHIILQSRFWTILGGASLIAALAGPFYTLERLSFSGRLLYWGITAVASGILMTFLSMVVRRVSAEKNLHWIPASILAGGLGVLPIMALIYLANRVSAMGGDTSFWSLFPYVSVPVILITVLVNAIAEDPNEVQSDSLETAEQPSLLFSKLPQSLGRDIVSIQAKDHYIEVTTPKGDALILMRLSDAEQDLATLQGMRVHRSWWVSLRHVQRIEKGTSGPELRMSTGQAVPVARGQRTAVRAALAQQSV